MCCEPEEVDEDLLLFGDGAPVLEAEAPPEEGTQDVLDKTKEVSVSNDWNPADNITTLVNSPCLVTSILMITRGVVPDFPQSCKKCLSVPQQEVKI